MGSSSTKATGGGERLIFLSPRRASPFLAWGDFHARLRFARSTIPEEKWGTTHSLNGSHNWLWKQQKQWHNNAPIPENKKQHCFCRPLKLEVYVRYWTTEKCARDNPERWYGIWWIHCSWHCSCGTYFYCFPLPLANIRPRPLVPFFLFFFEEQWTQNHPQHLSGCRMHFIGQPFSK